jgi:hypothetical protein
VDAREVRADKRAGAEAMKRYNIDDTHEPIESLDGDWVTHADHIKAMDEAVGKAVRACLTKECLHDRWVNSISDVPKHDPEAVFLMTDHVEYYILHKASFIAAIKEWMPKI